MSTAAEVVRPPRHANKTISVDRAGASFDIAELAAAVLTLVDDIAPATEFHYAGDPRRRGRAATAAGRGRPDQLGDAHVDRAVANTTELTADFQRFITEYASGSIWTRPGLDRRSRSMITLTALVARAHHEELAMHLRAARRNGLTNDEIRKVLLQSAIYCGVPGANTAFRIAGEVLADYDAKETPT